MRPFWTSKKRFKAFFSNDVMENSSATAIYNHLTSGLWGNTSAISSISMVNDNGSNFVQYSTSAVTETLASDTLALVTTIGINGSAQFNLLPYNLYLSPGDTISAFMSSTNSFNSSSIGITWKID